MKVKVEVDCTPEEGRAFLGLPDVSALNAHMVEELKTRVAANMAMTAPDELMKAWMAFGGQASEQFMKMIGPAAAAAGKKAG
ncbi:MAG: DUF6489 family protein [Caulobacteraceae bacterium]